jgi:hypothetical protein
MSVSMQQIYEVQQPHVTLEQNFVQSYSGAPKQFRSRPALGPTQPPIHRVPGAPSLGIKRPGREVYH